MNDYEFIEHVKLGAEGNFDSQGTVSKVLVVLERDALKAMMLEGMTPDRLKQVLDKAKQEYPMMATVMEGFTIKITKKNDIDVMPWEHPDRRESVIVVVYSGGQPYQMLVSPIVRPKSDHPFLGGWETNDITEELKPFPDAD